LLNTWAWTSTVESPGTRTHGSKDRKLTNDTNSYWDYWTLDHTLPLKTNYSFTRQYSNQCGPMTGTVGFIQTLQSRTLRKITNAPFYVSNHTLHKDLNYPFVHDLAIESYNKFHSRLNPHPNPLVQELTAPNLPQNPPRRFKRHWPWDLIQQEERRHWSEFFIPVFILIIKITGCLICD
jgi:hypothetical protein